MKRVLALFSVSSCLNLSSCAGDDVTDVAAGSIQSSAVASGSVPAPTVAGLEQPAATASTDALLANASTDTAARVLTDPTATEAPSTTASTEAPPAALSTEATPATVDTSLSDPEATKGESAPGVVTRYDVDAGAGLADGGPDGQALFANARQAIQRNCGSAGACHSTELAFFSVDSDQATLEARAEFIAASVYYYRMPLSGTMSDDDRQAILDWYFSL